MSLDLTLVISLCDHCGTSDSESFNYTYNVSQMWYEVYPEDDEMVQIEGMDGAEAAEKIQKAIWEMKSKRKFMKSLEPDNGWGDYEGFLEFLNRVYDASIKHPNAVWEANR